MSPATPQTHTPGGDGNNNGGHSANLESHIPSRPFQFSNIPQGRGGGNAAVNSSSIPRSSNLANHVHSHQQHQGGGGSGTSISGTPHSEHPPHIHQQHQQASSNDQRANSVGSNTPLGAGASASNTSASGISAAAAASSGTATTAKGRQGGGASDFVKKLYR